MQLLVCFYVLLSYIASSCHTNLHTRSSTLEIRYEQGGIVDWHFSTSYQNEIDGWLFLSDNDGSYACNVFQLHVVTVNG